MYYYDLALSLISLAFWLLFIYELFFVVGTREQGYISPDILYTMAFVLSATTTYHSNLNYSNKFALFLGMTSITIGTRAEYYKCFVMAGLSLCWIAIYYNTIDSYSSFGYTILQNPVSNYGPVNSMNNAVFGGPATHIAPRNFSAVGHPVPSNYAF